MPKVTVLMPAYNTGKYIKEAIDSVLAQTFEDFELLIMYNPSQDNTLEMIKSYNDDRIILVENETLLPLVSSLNSGLSFVTGDYIARMDSDDFSSSDRLEKQVRFLDDNPSVGLVCSAIDIIDFEGNELDSNVIDILTSEDIYYTLNSRNCIAHGSTMFRRDVIDTVGEYNEDKVAAEDYDLWNRVSKKFIIHKLTDSLYTWRVHSTSICSTQSDTQLKTAYSVFRNNVLCLLNKDVDDKLTKLMWDNFCNTKYTDASTYTREELITIAKLIKNINNAIIIATPHGLDIRKIEKLGNEKHMRYLIVMSKKLGLHKTLELTNEINENTRGKAEIISHLCNNIIKENINHLKAI